MTHLRIAVGPELPEFGSWNWIGQDLIEGLSEAWQVVTFTDLLHPPTADITVYLKFKPPASRLADLNKSTRLVFLPVDVYGSTEEIETDRSSLILFDLILVHSLRLVRYLSTSAKTEYIDHALRFVTDCPVTPNDDGPLLWAGKRCNIAPIADWCNRIDVGRKLVVLTNGSQDELTLPSLGFSNRNDVSVFEWSASRHVEATRTAFAALDIKGNDFRARHKPPAKSLDFLASGIPVIVNRGGSVDLHLATLGFQPAYCEGELAADLKTEVADLPAFTRTLRDNLSADKVAARMETLLQKMLHTPQKAA